MIKDNLLKMAIADAKAVRETALANAKLALTEAFTPRLQSMLGEKLRNEMEGDFEDGDLNDPAGVGEVDPTKVREEKDVTGDSGSDPERGKGSDVGPDSGGQGLEKRHGTGVKTVYEADEVVPDEEDKFPADGEFPVKEAVPGEEEEVPGEEGVPGEGMPGEENVTSAGDAQGEEGLSDEDNSELEEIIKELDAEQNELEAEPFAGEEEKKEAPAEAVDVTANAGEDPEKGLGSDVGPDSGSDSALDTTPTTGVDTVGAGEDELELDLENLVKEIEGEMGAEQNPEELEKEKQAFENLRKENVILKKSLKEHRSVVVYLRDRLNEINLLNAKLLFSNKLFRSNSLNESQRLRVVEAIDRANTIREVKLVYATLAESFKSRGTRINESKRPVASASKVVASTKPVATKVLNEGADLAARFKQLAGVKKISRIL